ncbi:DUF488 domain-containing protein [Clostridium saccharobutylicum]|uniref:Uncharacterized protein n=1 Tax=Clostridium saccharobutylicum TaxID=169679 RepID=A0A1S8NC42_CLOSA|nr:DUF488 family protein [Clostridium saccharobutylicum]OOM13942.1 hypothetical protein CLOSAC_20280 [Clostridium saccharobutylicum]
MNEIKIKRIYEQTVLSDGYRILVDRIWPRGLTKGKAKIYSWKKEIAPSTELRCWFGHNSERFPEFVEKYEEELRVNRESYLFKDECEELLLLDNITFVFAAKSLNENNAAVLKRWVFRNINNILL